MKNILCFVLFFSIIILDFAFFNYDLFNTFKTKERYGEIIEKYTEENNRYFPIYIPSNKMEINSCSQLPKIKEKTMFLNVFDIDDLKFVKKNCEIISILKSAKNLKRSFVDDVELIEFNKWNGDMIFEHTCKQVNDLIFIENYDKMSLKKIKEAGAIDFYTTNNKKELIIKDLLNERLLRIREIARGNFDDNDYMEILLEIAIADKTNNYIECYKFNNFSRENKKQLMHKI
jgi:hypothetical protein